MCHHVRHAYVSDIDAELRRLKDVSQQRMNLLRKCSKDAYEAVQWLRDNRDKFNGKIHDPIMTVVRHVMYSRHTPLFLSPDQPAQTTCYLYLHVFCWSVKMYSYRPVKWTAVCTYIWHCLNGTFHRRLPHADAVVDCFVQHISYTFFSSFPLAVHLSANYRTYTAESRLILQVNVKDPKDTKYIESHIAFKDMTAFVCENGDDQEKLLQILREQQKLRINVVGAPKEPLDSFQSPEDISRYQYVCLWVFVCTWIKQDHSINVNMFYRRCTCTCSYVLFCTVSYDCVFEALLHATFTNKLFSNWKSTF